MIKNPDNEDIDEKEPEMDFEAKELVEKLPGFQEYQKELRGDALNFGDY